MGKIFRTQDSLRIELSYLADISANITSIKIKYIKPDASTGEWAATHVPGEKKAYYDLPVGVFLDQIGVWRFWLHATMNDGRVIPGELVKQTVSEEGV